MFARHELCKHLRRMVGDDAGPFYELPQSIVRKCENEKQVFCFRGDFSGRFFGEILPKSAHDIQHSFSCWFCAGPFTCHVLPARNLVKRTACEKCREKFRATWCCATTTRLVKVEGHTGGMNSSGNWLYLLVRSCFLSAERRATPPAAAPPCSSNTPSKILLVRMSKAAEHEPENATRMYRKHVRSLPVANDFRASSLKPFQTWHVVCLISQLQKCLVYRS